MALDFKRKSYGPVLREVDYTNADGSTLPTLQFPSFQELGFVQHLFTTRLGGVSEGYFSSMNLTQGRGDAAEHVQENLRRVAAAFGKTSDRLVLSHQIHEANVVPVTAADAGAGIDRPVPWASADGLMTNVPGLILSTFYADCVPVLFADPVHRAVAASHSGWRGTVAKISAVTLQQMQETYGTNPADVLVGIGPSICQDCYEVSDDVAEQFQRRFPDHVPNILLDKHNGHQQLNLWETIRITLLEAGVPADHISVTDICTAENSDLLFSHRASHGRRGNFGGFIMIRV